MSARTMIWQTNYAGKLDFKEFVHVGILPPEGLKNFNCFSQKVIVKTKDNSYPDVYATLKDVLVYRFDEMPIHLLEWSHKMNKQQFLDFMRNQQKTIINYNTLVGCYRYRKD